VETPFLTLRRSLTMTENEVAKIIVDSAFTVHTRLGPGLLESVYEAIMEYELTKRGLHVVHQRPMPVKSVEVLAPVHTKQLLTYLRLSDKRLGLLINFGGALIKDGIRRVVNRLEE
jgi:PD-(D/E)XK nuclease superfamily protein